MQCRPKLQKKSHFCHTITTKPWNFNHKFSLWFNISTPTTYVPSFGEIWGGSSDFRVDLTWNDPFSSFYKTIKLVMNEWRRTWCFPRSCATEVGPSAADRWSMLSVSDIHNCRSLSSLWNWTIRSDSSCNWPDNFSVLVKILQEYNISTCKLNITTCANLYSTHDTFVLVTRLLFFYDGNF